MGRLIWNPSALEDLQRIAEYTREFTPEKEQQLIGGLVAKADQLRTFPHIGQKQSELSGGAREVRTLLAVKRYRLVYLVAPNDDVTILQVLDLRSDQEFYR